MNKHFSQRAGVPEITQIQEARLKGWGHEKVKTLAIHMAKGREKINHDILLEGDSQRRRTPGNRGKKHRTYWMKLNTVPTLHSKEAAYLQN